MQQEVTQSTGKVQEPIILFLHGQGQCAQGKVKQARETFAHAAAVSKEGKSWAAWNLAAQAYCDAEMGFNEDASQAINASLALYEDQFSRAEAARAFARIGDAARAERLIADLTKEAPFDTLLTQVKLPIVRAFLDLQRNQPAQAIAALDSATPYQLGADRRLLGTYGAIYVRGEAFLKMHDGAKAVAEFQKILDHRGFDPTSPFITLARLGQGRAYVLQGDTAKAKLAYQDFFAAWKDADPDVPVLKSAKAEYDKLK
jgi:tetratricopeptide (TPR) repeat protein